MKRSVLVLMVSAFVFIAAFGCNKKEGAAPAASTQAPAAMAEPQVGLSGKVVETMNAGGYTYVLIDNGSNKTWVAGPQTPVKVGQTVTCMAGTVMTNFTSPTLKRTFDRIVFSGGIR